MVKTLPANAGDTRDVELGSCWVGKILWSRKWQPTPVFLPGKFHAQRSLAGHSLWVVKESDVTEQLSTHIQTLMTSHYLCCHHPGPSHHRHSCLGDSSSFLPGLPALVFCHFYIQSQPNCWWCQFLLRLFLNALHFTQCKNHIFTVTYTGWKSPFTSVTSLSPATLAPGCQACAYLRTFALAVPPVWNTPSPDRCMDQCSTFSRSLLRYHLNKAWPLCSKF